MSWNPCHDCIPVLTSGSAPALCIPGGTAEERGRERKAHRPAGGASWPSLARLEGEGAVELERQMPSPPGGPLKSLCCQAGQGVCSGSLPPQPPPATRLGCPSWVRTPGEPGASSPDASLLLSSLFSPFFSVLFFPFLSFYLSFCLSHVFSLFAPVIVSHSLLYLPFSFFHAFSLYLFLSITFSSPSFSFLFLILLSFCSFLSCSQSRNCSNPGTRVPCTVPWERWALPL